VYIWIRAEAVTAIADRCRLSYAKQFSKTILRATAFIWRLDLASLNHG
jgi:hypothetical protein